MDRETCYHCFRTSALCVCGQVSPFAIEPLIVFLVHPREFMKTVGTVRLAHLSVRGSILIRGHGKEFDSDPKFLSILNNPQHHSMILFPGHDSLDLTVASRETIHASIPQDRKLVIFVIDGTWSAAKNMIRDSKLLRSLPKLSFQVNSGSIYEFRKQPKANCLSTIEATSLLVKNLQERGLCTPNPYDGHLKMIDAFKKIVTTQLDFESRPQHRQLKNSMIRKAKEGQHGPIVKMDITDLS